MLDTSKWSQMLSYYISLLKLIKKTTLLASLSNFITKCVSWKTKLIWVMLRAFRKLVPTTYTVLMKILHMFQFQGFLEHEKSHHTQNNLTSDSSNWKGCVKRDQQNYDNINSLTVQALCHRDLMPSGASYQFPLDAGYAFWIWPASLQLASLHL